MSCASTSGSLAPSCPRFASVGLADGMKCSFLRGFREAMGDELSAEDAARLEAEVTRQMGDEEPPTVAVIGEAGVGKSSTINALFNSGSPISHTTAGTREAKRFDTNLLDLAGVNGRIRVYDMPGLGESLTTQEQYVQIYGEVLRKVDVALWVVEGHRRAMMSAQQMLRDVIAQIDPDLVRNLVVGMNKIDIIHPGEAAWNPYANVPGAEQEDNVRENERRIRKEVSSVVATWRGVVIPYSATRRYRLNSLFRAMVEAVPEKRQWVLTDRMALADFFALVDQRMLDRVDPGRQYAAPSPQAPSQDLIEEAMSQLDEATFREVTRDRRSFMEWLRNHKHSGDSP